MSQEGNKTFMARASLFASPADSAAVPKKRVAREAPLPAPVFPDESTIQHESPQRSHNRSQRALPTKVVEPAPEVIADAPEADEDDVEPMEVDTTVVPSPEKAPQSSPPRGDTPCSKSTTPRRKSGRKSMPTPGKRLFFSSRDTETSECHAADQSTQLELLMANSGNEIPKALKNYIQDRKEMSEYDMQLRREIEEMEAIRKSRETMLKNATEVASRSHILSTVVQEIAPLDLTLRREQAPVDVVKRLYSKFLSITEEAGQKKIANRKALMEKETTKELKSHLERLENIKQEKDKFQETLLEKYEQESTIWNETAKQMEQLELLSDFLKPLPIF
ncbi:hypothetical protein GCK72_019256 [Caenorhabditis remanei]|uniref:Uncharacterized protein n=1 Tax=Caenorhabditis remanei TaxID=31234 RepID=A0A6A5GD97_CAERE|nr:hypothetical protein GCK72_019256 [Caenorhabditis remanei]KAF1752701.1 hypothetical protein GCK72_019256 [Caenorhabditis remanei]